MKSANERTFASIQRLVEEIRDWRCDKRIVFTNGCFDLLHLGHLRSLEAAKKLGDILIVGINSDASVARLKGPTRPIVPDVQRAEMTAGLGAVDYTFIFDEDTALESLTILQPDVYVKSADYDLTITPEGKYAIQHRIDVETIKFFSNQSTSNIISKVLRANGVSVIGAGEYNVGGNK